MFLGLPDPDPFVVGADLAPDPAPDPSIQCCGTETVGTVTF